MALGSILSNILGRRYTIGELMSIDPKRQYRASGCIVVLEDTFVTMKEESLRQKFKSLFGGSNTIKVFYVTVKLKVLSDTGNAHTVFIMLEPDFNLGGWMNNHIKIYCDCRDFMYRSAYILNKRDSLFNNEYIKIALGQALTEAPKSKSNTTTLCKHSYAALGWVLDNYNTVMNNL